MWGLSASAALLNVLASLQEEAAQASMRSQIGAVQTQVNELAQQVSVQHMLTHLPSCITVIVE